MNRRDLARRIGLLCVLVAAAGCDTLSAWIGLPPATDEPPPRADARPPPAEPAPPIVDAVRPPPPAAATSITPSPIAAAPSSTPVAPVAPLSDPLQPIERAYGFGALVPPSPRPPAVAADPLAPPVAAPAAAFAAEAGDRVFFAPNAAELGPRGWAVLERQAAWLRAYPQTIATIVGHAGEDDAADIRGPLSRARAEQVRQVLIRYGVAPERLAATGFSGGQPFASAVTAAGRALNRRAVTVITPR